MNSMNRERVKLIIHNMELLIQSLKDELKEDSDNVFEKPNSFIDEYEPDYYEVED